MTVDKSDAEVITTLIASHGDTELAAERLFGPERTNHLKLLERLPSLDLTTIVEGLKVARLLKTYDAFAITLETTLAELPDLPVQARSRFLTDLMDRLEVMMNPPVHGGSGQAANVQVNIGDVESARAQLASRIVQSTAYPTATRDSAGDASGGGVDSTLRLGAPSSPGATGAFDALVDMVNSDRKRVGQDTYWRSDDTKED